LINCNTLFFYPTHFLKPNQTPIRTTSTTNSSIQKKQPANMSDKNTSTLQSYIDGATGAVQSAIGSLTGNTSQEGQGEAKKDKAQFENEASHATAKIGNFTASSSGAVTQDDPNRTEGSWNQTIGSAKEAVGGFIGSEVSFPHSFILCHIAGLLTFVCLTGSQEGWCSTKRRG
jgi:uncharacterized protein YjbJ (UPF0337 family)